MAEYKIGDTVKIKNDKHLKDYIGKIIAIEKDGTLTVENYEDWGIVISPDDVEKLRRNKMKNQYIISYTKENGMVVDELINTDELGLISNLEKERVIITSSLKIINNVFKVRWVDKPPSSIENKIIELMNTVDLATSIEHFKLTEQLFDLLDLKEKQQLMDKLQKDIFKAYFEIIGELASKTKGEIK